MYIFLLCSQLFTDNKDKQGKRMTRVTLKMQLCLLFNQLRYTNNLLLYRPVYVHVCVAASIIIVQVGCFLSVEK